MDDLKLYLPFEKKDNDERIVAGFATTEDLDCQGEVVKLDAVEKALPDYMKYANIREMHQWSAVGKAIQATVDKSKKGLYLVAKVIDEQAWQKVKAGVYNGFSIGGKVVKKVGNEIMDLVLSEISLVDRPANPSATFSLVKMSDKQKDMTKVLDGMIIDAKAKGMNDESFQKILDQLKVTVQEQIAAKSVYSVSDSYFDQLKKVL